MSATAFGIMAVLVILFGLIWCLPEFDQTNKDDDVQ